MVEAEEDVKECETEDSIGISNVGTNSSPENEVTRDIVSNEEAKEKDLSCLGALYWGENKR